MAKIGISEFTFGFAFLYEQTLANWNGIRAAPVLPSLHEEKDLGWDAKLPVNGTDFYFQFKLSERLWRSNARYIRDGPYNGPYHRLALHPKDNNRQHRRLREVAARNPNTFYVAPEYDTTEEFNDAFLAGRVVQDSRLIPVVECGDYDDAEQHYITFQRGQLPWNEHSEPRWHDASVFGHQLEEVYRSTEAQWRRIDKGFAEEMFASAAAAIRTVASRERELWVSSYSVDSYVPTDDRSLRQEPDEPARRRVERPSEESLSFLDFDIQRATRSELIMRVSEIMSMTMGVTLVLVGAPA